MNIPLINAPQDFSVSLKLIRMVEERRDQLAEKLTTTVFEQMRDYHRVADQHRLLHSLVVDLNDQYRKEVNR